MQAAPSAQHVVIAAQPRGPRLCAPGPCPRLGAGAGRRGPMRHSSKLPEYPAAESWSHCSNSPAVTLYVSGLRGGRLTPAQPWALGSPTCRQALLHLRHALLHQPMAERACPKARRSPAGVPRQTCAPQTWPATAGRGPPLRPVGLLVRDVYRRGPDVRVLLKGVRAVARLCRAHAQLGHNCHRRAGSRAALPRTLGRPAHELQAQRLCTAPRVRAAWQLSWRPAAAAHDGSLMLAPASLCAAPLCGSRVHGSWQRAGAWAGKQRPQGPARDCARQQPSPPGGWTYTK